jgi:hypothetical protein
VDLKNLTALSKTQQWHLQKNPGVEGGLWGVELPSLLWSGAAIETIVLEDGKKQLRMQRQVTERVSPALYMPQEGSAISRI